MPTNMSRKTEENIVAGIIARCNELQFDNPWERYREAKRQLLEAQDNGQFPYDSTSYEQAIRQLERDLNWEEA